VTSKPHILSLGESDWNDLIEGLGEKPFRSRQIQQWIYEKGVADPRKMLNLSQKLREQLFETLETGMPEKKSYLTSPDGTSKFLFQSLNGHLIETVVMRYENRTTLCVSSQVGCKLACRFCQTGKLGFFRHLKEWEILSQLHLANDYLREEGRRISNVVYMGMGEPLDNYENVIRSVNRMIDENGYNLSARHVTISTSGLALAIEKLHKDTTAELAISLHAADDETRTSIMPINRRFPLNRLKQALMVHQRERRRKLTIEYILIKDVTCNQVQAKRLVKFLHGIRAKVNLIPFNDHPGSEYKRPSDTEIRNFQKYLADRSYPAPVRYSRGLEVSAACGQLAAKVQDELGAVPGRQLMTAKV